MDGDRIKMIDKSWTIVSYIRKPLIAHSSLLPETRKPRKISKTIVFPVFILILMDSKSSYLSTIPYWKSSNLVEQLMSLNFFHPCLLSVLLCRFCWPIRAFWKCPIWFVRTVGTTHLVSVACVHPHTVSRDQTVFVLAETILLKSVILSICIHFDSWTR